MDSVLAFILFPTALAVLIFSAHYFLDTVQKMGVSLGVRPFVMGSFIVAFGTSFPEVVISLLSVLQGIADVPVAQVVGSNIANILLVLGVAALLARKFVIGKNLVDVELPLIAAITALFVFVVFDGVVHTLEGVLLLIGFGIYAVYIFRSGDNRSYPTTMREQLRGLSQIPREIFIFIATALCIAVASHFVVTSTIAIASLLSVSEGVVAVTALALGTSLPELVVSVQAVLRNEIELVIGNVIGSNIFNILFVLGISALFSTLTVDVMLLSLGVPVLVGSTALLIVSGISNRMHVWEGLFYLLLYGAFVGSVIGLL
ncbi:MAG: calcium/sodium antiporter [Candidatus Kaiserbacteria bacterium]|nr:calcium/sodium antiporter [Candidatus Kaiserbacteria bacterium]